MLEKVDLRLAVPKATYKRRMAQLQERLYDLVHAAFQRQIPAMIVFEGWAAAGKGGTINVLTERLDPRGVRVVPISPPRTFETHYPWMWRYWQQIPASGQTIIYDTSWYRRVLTDRIRKNVKKSVWKESYQDIVEFETKLATSGALIRKFWLHISKKEQKRRFRKLLSSKFTSWQVTEEDAAQHKAYEAYAEAVEEMLTRTDFPHAPWVIVEATDRHQTRIKVFEEIVSAFEESLAAHAPPARVRAGRVAAARPHGRVGKTEATGVKEKPVRPGNKRRAAAAAPKAAGEKGARHGL